MGMIPSQTKLPSQAHANGEAVHVIDMSGMTGTWSNLEVGMVSTNEPPRCGPNLLAQLRTSPRRQHNVVQRAPAKAQVSFTTKISLVIFFLCGAFCVAVAVLHVMGNGANKGLTCSGLIWGALMCLYASIRIRAAATIEFQVQRLAEQNGIFKHQNGRLEHTVTHLKHITEDLHGELSKFHELRETLEQYGETQDKGLMDAIQSLVDIHHNIETLTMQNERVLLQRISQDIEFMDNEAGMTKDEYTRFLNRIPEHLSGSFHARRFSTLDVQTNESGQHVVTNKVMDGIIDTILDGHAKRCRAHTAGGLSHED